MTAQARRIARSITHFERGMTAARELESDLIGELGEARAAGRDALLDVVRLALAAPLPAPTRASLAAWAARGPAAREIEAEARQWVDGAIAAEPAQARAIVAAVPARWVRSGWLDAALAAPGARTSQETGALARACIVARGAGSARRWVTDAVLGPVHTSVAHLAEAWLVRGIGDDLRAELGDALLARAERPEEATVRVAARMCALGDDGDAVRLAERMTRLPLDDGEAYAAILAYILWVGGAYARASAVAAVPAAESPGGWGDQAPRSLRAFLRASSPDADPHETLRTVGAQQEHRGAWPAVGAMVGRLALMRMRAAVQIGDTARARIEAESVVRFHAYRAYDLHLDRGAFDPHLMDRVAVTPVELAEAEAIARGSGAHEPRLALFEGRILFLDAPGALRA